MTGIVHGGGEMGAFTPSDGSVSETTFSGTFDSSYARCSLQVGGIADTAAFAESGVFASLTTAWLHFDLFTSGPPPSEIGALKLLSLYDDTGQEVFYIEVLGSGDEANATWTMFYWAGGSTFTQIGAGFLIPMVENLTTFDLNVVFGATGTAVIYASGTKRDSGGPVDMSGLNCSRYTLHNIYQPPYFSQCLASGIRTIGQRVTTAPITGVGLTDSWSGVPSDINEIVYNDGNFISSGSANQISNFAQATTVVQPISAVIVTARANVGSTGPQNLELDLNVAATDYFSSTVAQSAGFSASVGVWLTNPATSAAWLATDWTSSVYYGVKSIA